MDELRLLEVVDVGDIAPIRALSRRQRLMRIGAYVGVGLIALTPPVGFGLKLVVDYYATEAGKKAGHAAAKTAESDFERYLTTHPQLADQLLTELERRIQVDLPQILETGGTKAIDHIEAKFEHDYGLTPKDVAFILQYAASQETTTTTTP